MTSVLTILAVNAALSVMAMTTLWAVSLRLRDVSFVDAWWGVGMVLLAASTFVQAPGDPGRKALLLGLCAAWGLRLGLHLIRRWREHGPDRRYVALLAGAQARHGWSFGVAALLMVFLLQAPIQFIVALPVQLGQVSAAPLGPLAWAGAALAVAGLAFETVADHQLARFRRDPQSRGQVLATGLWRYTRHPNYFGDACVWWGLYLVAAETSLGAWSVVGPLLLTWTLLKWSGAPLVEGHLAQTRPGYTDYVRRTSGFIPWFPKRER